jgi:predicted dehydrogenase
MSFSLPLQVCPADHDDNQAYRRAITAAAESGQPLDAAIVAVPDHLHYPIVRELLEAGLHTLVVKPFVTCVDHGDRLAAGHVGTPLSFVIEYSQRKQIPEEIFAGWVQQTDIFQYLGVHYADLVYFVTRARPVRLV